MNGGNGRRQEVSKMGTTANAHRSGRKKWKPRKRLAWGWLMGIEKIRVVDGGWAI